MLEQLSGAVLLGEHLGELADHLIGHFVDQARRSGASWTEIGQSMGVTKQAVQKRFVPKEGAAEASPFSRFTEAARQVIVQSQEAARAGSQARIGTEHLLLGLLTEPDEPGVRALVDQGIDLDQVRAAAKGVQGPPVADLPALIPYSPQAKKHIELAVREALRLGDQHVGTEHLLLGLAHEETGPGGEILRGLGFDRERADAWITGTARTP
ncbi:Clp protease N-terminal domain-containing protein [Actinocorallia lasiicapitis]